MKLQSYYGKDVKNFQKANDIKKLEDVEVIDIKIGAKALV